MVITGNSRGNGNQLAEYLVSMGENRRIQILEVSGRYHAEEDYLFKTMQEMALISEMAKGANGFYHAEINPAYGEDRAMTFDNWLEAADILGQELGLQDQRRIIVLHEKKGRLHTHVVWERYDHQQGKMISDSFSRLNQDWARKKMEKAFNHKPTPHRNKPRPEIKEALTDIWARTKTGQEFINEVYQEGYMVAQGVPARPFRFVDENGRSFDLVRLINGVRTKDVRTRLRNEKLVPEKLAIEIMRSRNKNDKGSGKSGRKEKDQKSAGQQLAAEFAFNRTNVVNGISKPAKEGKRTNLVNDFAQSVQDTTKESSQEKKKTLTEDFAANGGAIFETTFRPVPEIEISEPDTKQQIAQAFAENRDMEKSALTEEQEIQKLVEEQKMVRERMRSRPKRGIRR